MNTTGINAGQFANQNIVAKKLDDVLPLISDAKREAPSYWPKDHPYPTLREEARGKLYNLDAEIVVALAKHDHLIEAKDAFAQLSGSETYPWRAHLAIADANTRAGDINEANNAKRAILNMVLDGSIEARQMPYVIKAMYP